MNYFEDLDEDGAGKIMAAIVERACEDYKQLLVFGYSSTFDKYSNIDELERFFRSSWFEFLCPVMSGEDVMNYLKSEVGYNESRKDNKSNT